MSLPYAEVIGDPVAHSRSPAIHGFWLEKLGIAAEYRRCHVRADELATYFSRRREDPLWRGCNVTIPHKEQVGTFLDRIEESAGRISAVNTVFRDEDGSIVGTNTDIQGVDEALTGTVLRGREVCVIGSGGAARAAFAALAGRGCSAVRALARDPAKAVRVAAECGVTAIGIPLAPHSRALAGSALLVNATQLGMAGQPPMPYFVLSQIDGMAEQALVFDMVYAPLQTELLRAARQRGLRTADGLIMLVGQAAAGFAAFFARPAPRQHDAELRALLVPASFSPQGNFDHKTAMS